MCDPDYGLKFWKTIREMVKAWRKKGAVSQRTIKRRLHAKGDHRDRRCATVSLTKRLEDAPDEQMALRRIRHRLRGIRWPEAKNVHAEPMRNIPIYVLNGNTPEGMLRYAEFNEKALQRIAMRVRNDPGGMPSDPRNVLAAKVLARGERAKAQKSIVFRGWVDLLELAAQRPSKTWTLLCEDDVDLDAWINACEENETVFVEHVRGISHSKYRICIFIAHYTILMRI